MAAHTACTEHGNMSRNPSTGQLTVHILQLEKFPDLWGHLSMLWITGRVMLNTLYHLTCDKVEQPSGSDPVSYLSSRKTMFVSQVPRH